MSELQFISQLYDPVGVDDQFAGLKIRNGVGYSVNNGGDSFFCFVPDPYGLSVLGSVTDTVFTNSFDFEVFGTLAYVISSEAGGALRVVDCSNPASPTIIGSLNDANLSSAYRCAINDTGTQLYVVTRSADFVTVVDISDPRNPTVGAVYLDNNVINWPQACTYARGILYVHASGFGVGAAAGVHALDVTGFNAVPSVLGSLYDARLSSIENSAFFDAFSFGGGNNQYLFAGGTSNFPNYLRVVDVTDPAAMSYLTEYAPPNDPNAGFAQAIWDVVIDGSTLYCANDLSGLLAVDISTPGTPTTIDLFNNLDLPAGTPGELVPFGVDVSGGAVYTSNDLRDNITVFQLAPVSGTEQGGPGSDFLGGHTHSRLGFVDAEAACVGMEPTPVVMWDSRLHDGSSLAKTAGLASLNQPPAYPNGAVLVNQGSGPSSWDLDVGVFDIDNGAGFAIEAYKTFNWPNSFGTSGTPPFPSTWADLGGNPCDGGGITMMVAFGRYGREHFDNTTTVQRPYGYHEMEILVDDDANPLFDIFMFANSLGGLDFWNNNPGDPVGGGFGAVDLLELSALFDYSVNNDATGEHFNIEDSLITIHIDPSERRAYFWRNTELLKQVTFDDDDQLRAFHDNNTSCIDDYWNDAGLMGELFAYFGSAYVVDFAPSGVGWGPNRGYALFRGCVPTPSDMDTWYDYWFPPGVADMLPSILYYPLNRNALDKADPHFFEVTVPAGYDVIGVGVQASNGATRFGFVLDVVAGDVIRVELGAGGGTGRASADGSGGGWPDGGDGGVNTLDPEGDGGVGGGGSTRVYRNGVLMAIVAGGGGAGRTASKTSTSLFSFSTQLAGGSPTPQDPSSSSPDGNDGNENTYGGKGATTLAAGAGGLGGNPGSGSNGGDAPNGTGNNGSYWFSPGGGGGGLFGGGSGGGPNLNGSPYPGGGGSGSHYFHPSVRDIVGTAVQNPTTGGANARAELLIHSNTPIAARGAVPAPGLLASGSPGGDTIDIQGDHAFIANGQTLRAYDISSPPGTQVGTLDLGSGASTRDGAISLNGQYLYLVDNSLDRFLTIDITDPTAPFVQDSFTLSDSFPSGIARGPSGFLYICYSGASAKFSVIDATIPASPSEVTPLIDDPLLNGAQFVTYTNGYAFVSSATFDTIVRVDVSDPFSGYSITGSLTDSTNLPRPARLRAYGSYVYVMNVSTEPNRVTILDATTANPTVVGSIVDSDLNTTLPSQPFSGGDLIKIGTNLHVLCDGRIVTLDVSDPTSPTKTNVIANAAYDEPSNMEAVGSIAWTVGLARAASQLPT